MSPFSTYAGVTALVTGASVGLGAEVARQLAGRGARRLVLVARSRERLQALGAELAAAHGCATDVIALDLARPEGARELVAATAALGVEIDVLVNNAGFGSWGPFDAHPAARFRGMIELNVQTLVELTHAYGRGMLARGHGAVLNVGSLAGFFTMPYISVYAATKAFVLSFSEALWAEWRARGVTVTCLCPAGTESEFHSRSGTYFPGRRFMAAAPVMAAGLDGVLAGKPTVFASGWHLVQSRVPAAFTRRRAALLAEARLRPPPGWKAQESQEL